ncbi:MAG: amino acid ABC transporter permease [Candidatus Thermoplasmatota archaeon]|nr:amino acid ABC transporter permease [Candidatus Thermoplasmatota archaeon]RAH04926.1 MAG: hypothetical protein CMA00_005220 [Euryarchaeota archaeon]|tara:strand:+ start:3415 stop:4992 length:1578 start_codon:yes stop_codon:yes gene_type:complete
MISIIPESKEEALIALQKSETAVSGRSNFEGKEVDTKLSLVALSIGLISFIFYFMDSMGMEAVGEVTEADRAIYSLLSSAFAALAVWVICLVLLKQTFLRSSSAAILGILSAFLSAFLVEMALEIMLLEMRWDIVWSNRVLLAVGPDLTLAMTSDLIPAHNWRLWPFVVFSLILLGALYGTSDTKSSTFVPWFLVISIGFIAFATNEEYSNFNAESVRTRLLTIALLSLASFAISRWYNNRSEEYQVNRVKRVLTILVVCNFFLVIFMMDPPEFMQSLASFLSPIPIIGPMLDPLSEPGIPSTQWGGLFVNFIVATAGCVLGLGLGILFAFGRQSNLPVVKWPTVAFIEIFRSGPLICWLYFALFMLGDVADPLFSDPEDFSNILRMMAIFSFFGAVYIAEVIRGGLQSVDSGQKEAAIALGLSPIQTKQFVELPNAIRTTLPSIVSVFIGLWKDTTLLYIIGVLDFLKIASTLSQTDFNFMGYYLEPLYFAAIVFWLPAFYISRISMKVERSLGLVNEGGAERA